MIEEPRTIMPHPVVLEARWKSVSGDAHKGRVQNLSPVGCFLETPVQFHVREPLEMVMTMPNGERLAIWGEVMFNMPDGGIGVYFTDVNQQARESLSLFVEQYGRNEQAGSVNKGIKQVKS